MYSRQLIRLLIAAILVACIAQASWWDARQADRRALVGRQDPSAGSGSGDDPGTGSGGDISKPSGNGDAGGGSNTATGGAGNQPSETSSSAQQEPTTSQGQDQSPTATQPTQTPSETPKEPTSSKDPVPPTTSSSDPVQTPTQPSQAPPSSSEDTQPTSSSKDDQQPTNGPASSTVVEVVTSSTSGGAAGTASATPTAESTPGLNTDKSSSTSGLTPKTRNTVIGVVVGIGGAIVLGALGFVAWRIWGRKKHSEESDGLMDYNMGTGGLEKQEPSGATATSDQRTPFQSTLENYHQPSQVNASSNF